MRPGTRLNCEGTVAALQTIFGLGLNPGGLTALELQGFAHYLPLSRRRVVDLYGHDAVPKWLATRLPDVDFVRRLPLPGLGVEGLINFAYDAQQRVLCRPLFGKRAEAWPFSLSSPERAFLEVLRDVPETISFEHADQILQAMTTLSSGRMEKLLQRCTNVKVRRLFYWMAERHPYPNFRKIAPPETPDALGLGRGNRMVARGGRLEPEYMITVPEEMATSRTSTIDKPGC